MARFIVRMGDDVAEGLAWRSGTVLRSSSFDTTAIVKADETEKRIDIEVHGDLRRDYLGVVIHALREINASFERMLVVEKVPMPDRKSVMVSYSHLLMLESMGLRTFVPDGAERPYDVQELLGYVNPEPTNEEEILDLMQRLVAQNDTADSLAEKANGVFSLKPNVFGFGLDLNELARVVLGPHKGKGPTRGEGTEDRATEKSRARQVWRTADDNATDLR